jgi:ubiquinone biosynthesis monooxygenase Coq7
MTTLADRLIIEFDKALRTVAGEAHAGRPNPAAGLKEPELSADQRHHSAALMRVNHCGEVCAQALYQGQALASRNRATRNSLQTAAREEEDHLAWSSQRIDELGGRTSILNPLWYAGSLAIGFAAGKAGDGWNLGFLAETETQVGRHLEGHLARLSPQDTKTRAIVEAMHRDESGHAGAARALGARDLPAPVRQAMGWSAKLMTTSSYWV